MKRMVFLAIFAVLFSANVQADYPVDLYVGGQIWQSESSGIFGTKTTQIDFNLKKERQGYYFIAVENPFPFLPNLRIASHSLDSNGKVTSSNTFNFSDGSFTVGDSIDASFNVSYIDYTLYYALISSKSVSFDLGVTARDFNGDVILERQKKYIYTNCEDNHLETPCEESIDIDKPEGRIKTNSMVVFRNLCHFSKLHKTGMTHDPTVRLQQST